MKFRAWTDIFISIVMLIISGYLLADSSVMSLALLSNPNLNVAIELVRLFWGVAGVIYFLYYLYHGIVFLRREPSGSNHHKSVKRSSHRHSRKKRRRRKKSQKRSSK